jgi:hypothetical protein
MVIFGEKMRGHALKTLIMAVNDLLDPLGFRKTDSEEWRRNFDWKIEEIDLNSKASLWLLPTVRLLLPKLRSSSPSESHHYVAQANIGRFLHPHDGPDFDIKVPSVGFRVDPFVRTTVADINAALSWFNQFALPEDCMASLSKYLKPGCPAYHEAEDFLTSLSKQ